MGAARFATLVTRDIAPNAITDIAVTTRTALIAVVPAGSTALLHASDVTLTVQMGCRFQKPFRRRDRAKKQTERDPK